jgi:catechol 2,3-dioxygenase-like lactoylglutathione lyase family enzyme
MVSGAHMIIYSADADADRAFFRDVLKFHSVDAGEGWLIFALPPAEVAVHPMAESGSRHELYLMCDDVEATIGELTSQNVGCGPVTDEGWGLLTQISLPGGGRLGLYQPRHAVPSRAGAV